MCVEFVCSAVEREVEQLVCWEVRGGPGKQNLIETNRLSSLWLNIVYTCGETQFINNQVSPCVYLQDRHPGETQFINDHFFLVSPCLYLQDRHPVMS